MVLLGGKAGITEPELKKLVLPTGTAEPKVKPAGQLAPPLVLWQVTDMQNSPALATSLITELPASEGPPLLTVIT